MRFAPAVLLGVLLVGSACQSPSRAVLSDEELMARMMECGTPGAGHALLGQHVGRWNFTMRWWMKPGDAPTESTGTSECRWILDGRYVEDVTQSSVAGQPFHGRGLLAFDNLTQRYESIWIDNMSTGVFKSSGTYDPATRTFQFEGLMPDFATREYTRSRMIERWIDADHFTLEAYGPGPDGTEFKTMEMVYTRSR
ncbi:MAG: DUF1579 domain-containing protein [Planctomycetes bacterium]|nr:DUF1579 domain-containing protein [Planctomycetota bacterium]